jgi:hypothetical protein
MRDDHAQALMDLAMVAIGAVAVVYVVRTPSLRRVAWNLLKQSVFTAAPAMLWSETTRAWTESAKLR